MDPNELVNKTYGNACLLALVVALILGYAAFNLFLPLWSQQDGVITADPFTYVAFARSLAQGHFYLHGPLAEGIQALYGNDTLAAGPIWNTNVQADGKTLYTVAIGYPLFLAAVLKTAGLWACLSVNALLLALVVALLAWVVWEGTDRSPAALVMGGLAALLLVHSQPQTFQQFMDPWREPLFYVCLLGGVLGVLQYLRTGRLAPLAPAGFLAGYACCIKEPNILYGAWLGVCLVTSGTFRTHPRKGAVLACFVGAGLAALLPLLVQNHFSTGRFYLSLQFVRATQEYSIAEAGAGVSGGNLATTVRRYIGLYRQPWMFAPGLLAAGLFGLAVNLRYPVIRILSGMVLLHLALYTQWGSADFRHMYFAHIPYVVFLAAALRTLTAGVLRRLAIRDLYLPWVMSGMLLALAVWPSPWRWISADQRVLPFDQARSLAHRVDRLSDPPKLVLSNRILRDILAIHCETPVARLGDLLRFDPDGDARTVVDFFLDQGRAVYVLDNQDLDPRNVGRRDWSRRDRKLLLDHYDLVEVDRIPARDYAMASILGRDELIIHQVRPWGRSVVEREVVTAGGDRAAFVFLEPRALGEALQVQVNGRPVPAGGYPFIPLPEIDPGPVVEVRAEAGGAPVPALQDLKAIGWAEPIRLECGPDAIPDDQFLFREAMGASPGGDFRYFKPDIPMRLPARSAPDLFTTIGLGVNSIGTAPGHVNVTVQQADGPEQLVKLAGGRCYFPILSSNDRPWAGMVDVTLRTRPGLLLKLSRVNVFSSVGRLEHDASAEEYGVALRGLLTPRAYGEGMHPWQVRVNGMPRDAGLCYDDPGRERNGFALVVSGAEVEPHYEVAFAGAGLIKPQWIEVGKRLDVRAGDDAALLWTSGFHPAEGNPAQAFRWTDGNAVAKVPVGPDETLYRLELDLMDGHPSEVSRVLTLRIEGVSANLTLPKERAVLAVDFAGVRPSTRGLADLQFVTDAWVPRELLPHSRDSRSLGFQLYGLRWDGARAGRYDPEDME